MSIENADRRSRSRRRIFHWLVALHFFVMAVSGLILYVPALSTLAADSWTRIIHRAGAVSLAAVIVAYAAANRRNSLAWLNDAALWKAAAPPHPDSWKRKHKLLISLGVVLFAATGFIQWFLKDAVPDSIFVFCVMVHDILFFAAIIVLLLHIYHEMDWWLWKKRRCSSCSNPLCARVCPSSSISVAAGGSVTRDDRCNSCRLCMNVCRRKLYYVSSTT